jgi:hypothetical protein
MTLKDADAKRCSFSNIGVKSFREKCKTFLHGTLVHGVDVIKQTKRDFLAVHGSCWRDYDEISYWSSL